MLNYIFHRYSRLILTRFATKCNYSQKMDLKMDKIRTVIVDLSGTIHIDDKEIPGSVEALRRLKSSDLNVKFVTNTTKESCDCLLRRLTKIGFDIKQSDLFTSVTAARRLIQKKNVRPLLLVDDRAMEDFKGINTEEPNAVVIGLAPDKFSYDNMNTAFRLVLDKADLIAIHKARYYKTSDGLSLGPGPFVTALEYASDVKAEVVGKPQKSFFLASIEEFQCLPEECVMIGDDARDDVAGAQKAGMMGILVQTGKYRTGDESKFSPKPDKMVNNFSDAVDYILMFKSSSS